MTSAATKPSTPKANRPIETINAGAVQASIWKNEAANGEAYFSATFSRRWKDAAGKWSSSTSFGTGELLQLSHAANRAYSRLLVLREAERQASQSMPEDTKAVDRERRPPEHRQPPTRSVPSTAGGTAAKSRAARAAAKAR